MCLTDPSNDQLVKDKGHKSFITFDRKPGQLVLELIMKSLTEENLQIVVFDFGELDFQGCQEREKKRLFCCFFFSLGFFVSF